ncbi:myb-like protein A [Physella acuta]|uniref:myb-like protein A n=1 Tax=Physella acuta TaxID=109671 RepID=UPI0027DCD901|nr:myb-like protein A [Physella acuta]XP_059159048.1 myb-like protein A [Physella acuta]XP_059159049.1 myb-like protein A [Physella acuta]
MYNVDECERARKKLRQMVLSNLGQYRRWNLSLRCVKGGVEGWMAGPYSVEDFPKPRVTLASKAKTPDPCVKNNYEVENPDPNTDNGVNNENKVENPDPNNDHVVNNENKVETPDPNNDYGVNNENQVTRKKTEHSTDRSRYWYVDRKGSQTCKYNLRKKIKYHSVVFSTGTNDNELNSPDGCKHRTLSARKTKTRPEILNVISDTKLCISKSRLSENGEETPNNDTTPNWPNGSANVINL